LLSLTGRNPGAVSDLTVERVWMTGGSDSIYFCDQTPSSYSKISSCQFIDSDGYPVICDLFADQSGTLTELSFWKATFEPILKFPEKSTELGPAMNNFGNG